MNCPTSARRTSGNSAFMPSEPCDGCAAGRHWWPPSGNRLAFLKSVSYNMRESVGRILGKRAFEAGTVPYTVKISFIASGETQEVGAGEMEETRNAAGV